jgi:Flp pilus assembly protein TadD
MMTPSVVHVTNLTPGVECQPCALGVLAHLSRSYDEAIAAFNTALEIDPQNYSLWNKLGATQANSARSADAMGAYQRALVGALYKLNAGAPVA